MEKVEINDVGIFSLLLLGLGDTTRILTYSLTRTVLRELTTNDDNDDDNDQDEFN